MKTPSTQDQVITGSYDDTWTPGARPRLQNISPAELFLVQYPHAAQIIGTDD